MTIESAFDNQPRHEIIPNRPGLPPCEVYLPEDNNTQKITLDNARIGLPVVSRITGKTGLITAFTRNQDTATHHGYAEVTWSDGKISLGYIDDPLGGQFRNLKLAEH